MNMQRCFLIGHRDAPKTIWPALIRAVEEHILHKGVTEFLVGHYGAFDRMAAEAVRVMKGLDPRVRGGRILLKREL